MSALASRRNSGKRVSARIKDGWTLIRSCLCCGKFIVLLKLPSFGSKTDPRWYKVCYFKGWDGSPFWYPGSAIPHPRKTTKALFEKPVEEISEEDAFFSL